MNPSPILKPRPWSTIAWNGIAFSHPARWQPGRVGRRHLILEANSQPVLELKWQTIRGRFSARRQLKRLAKRYPSAGFTPCDLQAAPPAWQAPLGNYETTCFKWQDGPQTGLGALLYCPQCGTATLIQFLFPSRSPMPAATSAAVLASFRDHARSPWRQWAIFDIMARLPASFTLLRHQFSIGRYTIAFKDAGIKAVLYRWAPASVLLLSTTLAEFGARQLSLGLDAARPEPVRPDGSVQWDPPAVPGRLWQRLMRPSARQRMRLWHVAAKNRILGVEFSGRKVADLDLFNEICAYYETT
jgi:hypothetical protein